MTTGFDFENDAPENNTLDTTSGAAGKVLRAVNRLTALNKELAELEVKQKGLQDQARRLEEEEIPLAMDEANISKLTLTSGQVLKLKNILVCSIPKDREEMGFEWLRTNGFGDLIKRDVNAKFGKGEEEKANKLAKLLAESGFQFTDKSSVHYQTMNAFAREQFEAGKDLPSEIFNTFKGRKAVIGSK